MINKNAAPVGPDLMVSERAALRVNIAIVYTGKTALICVSICHALI